GLARPWVAVAAATRRIEPEGVAGFERIVGVAGRQTLGIRSVRIDPDVAGAAGLAAGAADWRNHMFRRTDGKARIREIEIFAAATEPAAELSGAAGITDQLEPQKARREFALDDLDGCDLGVALIDGDGGRAVLAAARAGAAGQDLILHIAFAGI